MTAPLYQEVGPIGFGPACTDILNGSYNPPANIDEYARKLLPHLQRPANVDPQKFISTEISVESHTTGWAKVREATSSGISSIHFGHFIAGSTNPVIAAVEATMMALPYQTGFSPARWRKGINVMLEKKKGNFNLEKLRAILLFECDFNQNNKYLGRSMTYNA